MKIHRFDIRRGLLCWSLVLFSITSSVSAAREGEWSIGPRQPGESDLIVLTTNLLSWIGEHSSYSVKPFLQDLPEVSFCDREQEISYEGRTIIMHEPVRGVYDATKRKIFLVRPWSSQNFKNVGTLLHELVHYVQYSTRQWDCWHETEWEAYKLQEAWLQQHGIDPEFNWTEIFLLSRCSRRDIHR